jgi:hypothetical protein
VEINKIFRVHILTCWKVGVSFIARTKYFSVFNKFRPILEPTQFSVQWILEGSFPGGKAART